MFQTKIIVDKNKAALDDKFTYDEMVALIDSICEDCEMVKAGDGIYELLGENRDPYPKEHHATLFISSELERYGHIIPCLSEWKFYDDHQGEPGEIVEEDMLDYMRKHKDPALLGIPTEED